jgi:CheY-like chemotaxis protein
VPEPAKPARWPGLRVLLAEENPVSQRLARHLLESAGCRVEVAANGQDCLERLAARPFDAAWIDLELAGIDGLTLIRLIRAGEVDAIGRDLWIAALTTDVTVAQRELATASGANDYLAKPVALMEVEAALGRGPTVRP